jgi:hypothetical protein
MNKVIVTTIGVLLATAAVSASAGREYRQQLTQCKADIAAHYGAEARTRLRSIKRGQDGTTMRLLVMPAVADSEVVLCVGDGAGPNLLTDRDGIALAPAAAAEQISQAH